MNSFEEIVFEKKNKLYGAYIIRKYYNNNLAFALTLTLFSFFIVSLIAFKINPDINKYTDMELQQEIVEYEQYNMLKNLDSLLIYKPPQIKVTNNENKIPVVVDSIKTENDTVKIVKFPEKKNDTLINDSINSSDSSQFGSINGKNNGTIYTRVDELPEFPGGYDVLKQYLLLNTHYPEEAKKANIKGVVHVQFVITKDGYIDNVTIKKGIDALLNNEAIRVVKSFPKWKPAKRKGKAVNVWCVLPFNFQM